MKYLIAIFIFCLVLFLYLHIQYHLKTSNELEVYSIEHPSKEKLEEICDLRQPVIFDFYNERLMQSCNLSILDDNYGAFDIKLRNTQETDENSEMYLPFLFKEAIQLFQTDKNKKFITENNSEFLEETSIVKNYKYNDGFLRPSMVSKCIYDFWSGSVGCCTPLRYYLNYRNFIYLTEGQVKLKLIPPQSSKYLDLIKDYENGEYRSPVNPWDVQQEYKAEYDKVKALDIDLQPGMMIYIPAYWWCSIQYEKMSSICSFQYRTYMNTLAVLPELIMGLLQRQNIQRQIAPKVDTTPSVDPPPPPPPPLEVQPTVQAAPSTPSFPPPPIVQPAQPAQTMQPTILMPSEQPIDTPRSSPIPAPANS